MKSGHKINHALFALLAMCFLNQASPLCLFAQGKVIGSSIPIQRMGASNVQSFDDGWLFSRFGLQADGTTLSEPPGMENPVVNDENWRKLDLPHD